LGEQEAVNVLPAPDLDLDPERRGTNVVDERLRSRRFDGGDVWRIL
jgi:hypothetical protein